jgi:hypothetical protein
MHNAAPPSWGANLMAECSSKAAGRVRPPPASTGKHDYINGPDTSIMGLEFLDSYD